MKKNNVLAIDPGREKCGIAVLAYNYNVIYQNIIPSAEIQLYLAELMNKNKIQKIVLGNGTSSDIARQKIENEFDVPVEIIDEAYTTEKAEERYRRQHYKKGWKKMLAYIKWKPARPLDDYSAVILAEKYLKEKEQMYNNNKK